MKILDMGAHDGFVSVWLAKQLREHGVTAHIDGIELHPDGVSTANRRLKEADIEGEFKQGLAEDAMELFSSVSYDAVVGYEIIEHVPSVDLFLNTCEWMLKPGGRVYLSTPDGCFGSGQNPHHLRVYRSIDLFDLLRERGKVMDMLVGLDGVSVISYEPHINGVRPYFIPPKRAHIYCGPGWEKWLPTDITTKGLGGSETAAVLLASALSDQGYIVTVYGEVEECMWRQVSFRHHSTYDQQSPSDLTIISRTPHMLDRPLNSRRTVLWMHDTDYGQGFTKAQYDRLDAVAVLSEWHKEHVLATYPFIDAIHGNGHGDKIIVTRNGIDPERFPVDRIPQTADRPKRAIYSSSPDRGLDLMLKLWPQVRERVPDAELVYCYSAVYDAIANTSPPIAAFRESIRELAKQDGVTNLGSLGQTELAGAMAMSRVWLAPSFNSPTNQPFYETFCIGAVEAAAAGCSLVMSNWGALTERASVSQYATLIDAPYGLDPINVSEWVDVIVRDLQNDYNVDPSKEALAMTWEGVARDLSNVRVPV